MLTRTKLKTEDRQVELVQVALALAAERSPVEITTGDLARAVGITQGAVFRHFESKEAIWLAALDWAHQSLMGSLHHVAQLGQANALDALRAVFMAHIDFVQEHPGVPRLVFQELQHARPTPLKEKVQQLMADYRGLISSLLAKAHQEALIAPGVDRQSAVVLFMGAVQGLVMQSLVTGTLKDMRSQGQAVFNIYQAGLQAPETSEPRKFK